MLGRHEFGVWCRIEYEIVMDVDMNYVCDGVVIIWLLLWLLHRLKEAKGMIVLEKGGRKEWTEKG